MADMLFGKLLVRDTEHEVFITSVGAFYAQLDGVSVTSPTLDGLRRKLAELARQRAVRVAVHFTRRKGDEAEHGIATGIHATTGKILARFAGNRPEQLDMTGADILRPLTEEEAATLSRLSHAARDARKALDDFIRARHFRLREAVQKAIAEAVKQPEAAGPNGEEVEKANGDE